MRLMDFTALSDALNYCMSEFFKDKVVIVAKVTNNYSTVWLVDGDHGRNYFDKDDVVEWCEEECLYDVEIEMRECFFDYYIVE